MLKMKNAAASILPIATVLLAGLGLTACGESFDSQMMLSGYRVVGVEASSPEVAPGGATELLVHDFNDGDDGIMYEWKLCLYSQGFSVDYECASPDWEFDVGSGPRLNLDFGEDGIGLERLLTDLPELANEDGTPRNLEAGFDVWVKLRSGPDCGSCRQIDTVKRLTVRAPGAQAFNKNPEGIELRVPATAKRGETVALKLDTGSPELYHDPLKGQRVREEYLYSWYTSEGEASPTRTFGENRETELELPDSAGEVEVVVTVRDGRGGLTVERQTITVE